MKVLVFGAGGQLGSELVREWRGRGAAVTAAARAEADITDPRAVERLFREHHPEVVINAAAYTRVDQAESASAQAFATNAGGAFNVARAAEASGTLVVHFSTDYVFDGAKGAPYDEEDVPRPLNVYGTSKLAGERLVQSAAQRALVVRVSALFGRGPSPGTARNFVETMLRLAGEGGTLRVVDDQITSPTSTADVVAALWPLVEAGATGTVHLASDGHCSWYELACAIFEESRLGPDLAPTTTADFGAAARRPAFSALRSRRVPPLPHWRDALRRYLAG